MTELKACMAQAWLLLPTSQASLAKHSVHACCHCCLLQAYLLSKTALPLDVEFDVSVGQQVVCTCMLVPHVFTALKVAGRVLVLVSLHRVHMHPQKRGPVDLAAY